MAYCETKTLALLLKHNDGLLWNQNTGFIVKPKHWLYCETKTLALLWNQNTGFTVKPKH